MTVVRLDGVTKRYERIAVVDGVSLEARPGQATYIVGPAGAGKTTLARLIAGLEDADDGEIEFGDRVVDGVPAYDRGVGMVFRDDAFWPHLTTAQNVEYGLAARGVGRRERKRRVGVVLASVGLDSAANVRAIALSPLQRRRASLARSLVSEPAVLLLDEPHATLEGRDRADFADQIRTLGNDPERTTLVFTRDARQALPSADRMVVIDLGRVVQWGRPATVYNEPVDTFVAQYLGPVNLIQGQLDSIDGRGDAIVRTPIGRLVGTPPAEPPPAGAPVTVAIRPETLVLGGGAPLGANRFAATIERQVFQGELREIHLRGPGDWPVRAVALQAPSQSVREGQGVTVAVAPEFVRVLPARFASGG